MTVPTRESLRKALDTLQADPAAPTTTDSAGDATTGGGSTVAVEISNTYACGRESDSTEHVRYPQLGETLESWWDDVVHDLTGDGHPCGSSEHALYEAVITAAPDRPELVGETWSAEG